MQVSEAQKGVGSNHAVSGLKFRVLRPMLDLGYAVLLSDVDIITLQNPFRYLHRDCDVEGMSDGWDNATAYGEHAVVTHYKFLWEEVGRRSSWSPCHYVWKRAWRSLGTTFLTFCVYCAPDNRCCAFKAPSCCYMYFELQDLMNCLQSMCYLLL